MYGKTQSLNASVAAAVLLYEAVRQRHAGLNAPLVLDFLAGPSYTSSDAPRSDGPRPAFCRASTPEGKVGIWR